MFDFILNSNLAYPECDAMEFRCKNQRCVPLEYVCDGQNFLN